MTSSTYTTTATHSTPVGDFGWIEDMITADSPAIPIDAHVEAGGMTSCTIEYFLWKQMDDIRSISLTI